MSKTILHISLVLNFLLTSTYAARPLSTDDAGTVPKNAFEIETGYTYTQNITGCCLQSAEFALKHGITEKMDLGVTIPSVIYPFSELETVELGMKFVIMSGEVNIPSVSLSLGIAPGHNRYSVRSIFSWEFNSLGLHCNAGYAADPGIKGTVCLSGAGVITLSDRFRAMLEAHGETDVDSKTSDLLQILVGTSIQWKDNIAFDLGLGTSFNDGGDKIKTTAGLTIGF